MPGWNLKPTLSMLSSEKLAEIDKKIAEDQKERAKRAERATVPTNVSELVGAPRGAPVAPSGNRCLVLSPSGGVRFVKNLGWLRDHWKDVDFFVVEPYRGSGSWDAWLFAKLTTGGWYVTPFASLTVLREWIHRPVFRTLPVRWLGSMTEA